MQVIIALPSAAKREKEKFAPPDEFQRNPKMKLRSFLSTDERPAFPHLPHHRARLRVPPGGGLRRGRGGHGQGGRGRRPPPHHRVHTQAQAAAGKVRAFNAKLFKLEIQYCMQEASGLWRHRRPWLRFQPQRILPVYGELEKDLFWARRVKEEGTTLKRKKCGGGLLSIFPGPLFDIGFLHFFLGGSVGRSMASFEKEEEEPPPRSIPTPPLKWDLMDLLKSEEGKGKDGRRQEGPKGRRKKGAQGRNLLMSTFFSLFRSVGWEKGRHDISKGRGGETVQVLQRCKKERRLQANRITVSCL